MAQQQTAIHGAPKRITLVAVGLVFAVTGMAFAQAPGEFRGRPPIDWSARHHPTTLIVGFSPASNASDRANSHAAAGARRIHSFSRIPAEVVAVNRGVALRDAVTIYSRRPGVAYAEPNYEISADLTLNDPRLGELWGLNNTGQTGGTTDADIDAPEAWAVTGGEGVLVGMYDDGCDVDHEDLRDNYSGIGHDATLQFNAEGADDPRPKEVGDRHGTAVMGLAAARSLAQVAGAAGKIKI